MQRVRAGYVSPRIIFSSGCTDLLGRIIFLLTLKHTIGNFCLNFVVPICSLVMLKLLLLGLLTGCLGLSELKGNEKAKASVKSSNSTQSKARIIELENCGMYAVMFLNSE